MKNNTLGKDLVVIEDFQYRKYTIKFRLVDDKIIYQFIENSKYMIFIKIKEIKTRYVYHI